MNKYQLCAFADEASPKLTEQIVAMRENNIEYLEMRGVNGTNVAKLTAAQAKDAARELSAAGLKVWSLGSPAGKSPITQDFAVEREQFLRLLETAEITGARCIRLFSFYGTDGKPEYRDEVLERLSRFIDLAKGSGVPNKNKVATISKASVQKIAEIKMRDLNAASLEAAMSMIAGTCRSMGVVVEE